MDRNILPIPTSQTSSRVALRKESVDRNKIRIAPIDCISRSLSARRAWIEIGLPVANTGATKRSLSARRAWIEILFFGCDASKSR